MSSRRAALSAAILLTVVAPAGAGAAATETRSAESWFTADVLRRAHAAGTAGVPVPDEVLPDRRSSVVFTGIRPGTWLRMPRNTVLGSTGCTANFVYQTTAGEFDPTQVLYIGTAGHCGPAGTPAYAVIVPPSTDPGQPVLVHIGDVHTATVSPDIDFGLIQIRSELRQWVSPSTAHLGGPTAIYGGGVPAPVRYTGHGVGFGPGGTPRVGLMSQYADGILFHGPSSGGDSGAPVLTPDGLAVGEIAGPVGNLTPDDRLPQQVKDIVGGLPASGVQHRGPSASAMQTAAGKPMAVCTSAMPWPLPGCPPD